jgi:hypothetical protein
MILATQRLASATLAPDLLGKSCVRCTLALVRLKPYSARGAGERPAEGPLWGKGTAGDLHTPCGRRSGGVGLGTIPALSRDETTPH